MLERSRMTRSIRGAPVCAVCTLVSALLCAAAARATTIVHLPFDEMVRSSGLIVKATVVQMRVELEPGRRGAAAAKRPKQGYAPRPGAATEAAGEPIPAAVPVGIGDESGPAPSTHITLAIEDVVKGTPAGRILRLRAPGGPIGERRLQVIGLPVFETGGRYYLFLRPDCESVGDFVVGVNQGFFRIERDPVTGADTLADSEGTPIAGVEHNDIVRLAGGNRRAAPLTASRLTELVRSVPGWDRIPSRGGRP